MRLARGRAQRGVLPRERGLLALEGAVILALLGASARAVAAEPLSMAFNERRPYHYSEKGSPAPRGLVGDLVVKIVRDCGLDVRYVSMETSRISKEIQGSAPFCSFSWFMNEERRKFAKFTHALWQDEPFVVVARKEKETRLRAHKTLADVFRDDALVFGTRKGTSYNDYVDKLKLGAKASVVEPDNTQVNMVRMLAAHRFDFMILAPVEIDALLELAGEDPGRYAAIKYPDIPRGGKRRIMCSRSVPDEVIERLNRSIEKFVDRGVLE